MTKQGTGCLRWRQWPTSTMVEQQFGVAFGSLQNDAIDITLSESSLSQASDLHEGLVQIKQLKARAVCGKVAFDFVGRPFCDQARSV
jgi:hypothetical protein